MSVAGITLPPALRGAWLSARVLLSASDPSEDVLLELGSVHVGLTRGLERVDRGTDTAPSAVRHALGAALLLGLPDCAYAQTRAHLVVGDADDVLTAEVGVGAVEQHRRVHERLGLLLAVVRDGRDDREAGHRSGVGDLDFVLLGRCDDAHRAVPLAGHVHAAARRALVADDVTVDELVDEAIEDRRQLFLVRERDEVLHHQRLLRNLSGSHTASHASRSVIMLCDSPRQRGCTRIPVDMRSMFSTSTTCTIAESAPSGLISANANGWSSGCFDVGSSTHVHDSTVPAGPTSTMSVRASPVYGSY